MLIEAVLCFEVTLKGFEGSTDATDDLVKWVVAPGRAHLDRWLDKMNLRDFLYEEPQLTDHKFDIRDPNFWKSGVDVVLCNEDERKLVLRDGQCVEVEDGTVWKAGQSLGRWKIQCTDMNKMFN